MKGNLGSIGHNGNINSYGSGASIYSKFNVQDPIIKNTFNKILDKSAISSIVTLGLDSIFKAGLLSTIFTGLEATSILNFTDPSKIMTSMRAPLPNMSLLQAKGSQVMSR